MLSIDQNCHSLWDALPKLHAMGRQGRRVRHFIEDIDVAFTAVGAGDDAGLRLARERYHHSGGADSGAALFYSEFLGRLPVDVRDWEPLTGLKTSALARQLGRSVENLFDEFSPSDNWQLIGPSYVGDHEHHRIIGDLSVRETAPFLLEMMDKARRDMLRAFPEPAARVRVEQWLSAERARLDGWIDRHAAGRLVDLYREWMGFHLSGSAELGLTSELFACRPGRCQTALLELFLRDYDLAAGLYNESLAEAGVKLRPLHVGEGELPFFAALTRDGHRVRTGVSLREGELLVGGRTVPLANGSGATVDALSAAGVEALVGKAVILILQVRLGRSGEPLALPYRGSLYAPAADRLADKLLARGLLPGPLAPIVRVRFRLLDRMRSLDTVIRLPEHLAAAMGEAETTAKRLAESHADLAAEAADRLEKMRTPEGRQAWLADSTPDLLAELDQVNGQRKDLAASGPDPAKIRPLSQRARVIEAELLDRSVRQIARDRQVAELDYWDSRGALLPWSIALGGEEFYDRLLREAEVYEEPHGERT